MSSYSKQYLMMNQLGLIDSPRDFPSIRVISFIIYLYLILLITVVKVPKTFAAKFSVTKLALSMSSAMHVGYKKRLVCSVTTPLLCAKSRVGTRGKDITHGKNIFYRVFFGTC